MESELLPLKNCPFCGSNNVGDNRDKMDDIPATRIICYECLAQEARGDGWVHKPRPDKPQVEYLIFPGN